MNITYFVFISDHHLLHYHYIYACLVPCWVLGQITMFLANKVFPKTLASFSTEIGRWGGVKFCKTSLRVWYLDRAQCSFTQGHKMTLHNEQCGIGSSRTFLVFWMSSLPLCCLICCSLSLGLTIVLSLGPVECHWKHPIFVRLVV